MSAVRKIDYYANEVLRDDDGDQAVTFKVVVKKQPILVRVLSISLALFVSVSMCFMGLIIVKRHAKINQMQLEIFNAKRSIKKTQVMIDELIVKRETFMTIEEVESYATEKLGMIKPSDGNKVIINSNRYVRLDQSIAFKRAPLQAVQDNWSFGGAMARVGE